VLGGNRKAGPRVPRIEAPDGRCCRHLANHPAAAMPHAPSTSPLPVSPSTPCTTGRQHSRRSSWGEQSPRTNVHQKMNGSSSH
jgi:hypothetical protein